MSTPYLPSFSRQNKLEKSHISVKKDRKCYNRRSTAQSHSYGNYEPLAYLLAWVRTHPDEDAPHVSSKANDDEVRDLVLSGEIEALCNDAGLDADALGIYGWQASKS